MFIAFAIVFALTVIATLYLCIVKRTDKKEDELLRIKEITETTLLGVFLWIENGFLLYTAIINPERLLTNRNAVINTSIFLLLGMFMGSYMILYGIVKCVVVKSEGITEIDVFGRAHSVKWEEISEAKRISGKRIMFISRNGSKVSVGGRRGDVKAFILMCDKYITSRKARDVVGELKKALKI